MFDFPDEPGFFDPKGKAKWAAWNANKGAPPSLPWCIRGHAVHTVHTLAYSRANFNRHRDQYSICATIYNSRFTTKLLINSKYPFHKFHKTGHNWRSWSLKSVCTRSWPSELEEVDVGWPTFYQMSHSTIQLCILYYLSPITYGRSEEKTWLWGLQPVGSRL